MCVCVVRRRGCVMGEDEMVCNGVKRGGYVMR